MSIKKLREDKKISPKSLAKDLEIDVKALKYIENKDLLPTVKLMDQIETIFDIDRLELYDKKELQLLKKKKNTKASVQTESEYYHFQVRLNKKYKVLFTKEAVALVNSGNMTHWFEKEVLKLARRLYNNIERKKKKDRLFNSPEELQVFLNELFKLY